MRLNRYLAACGLGSRRGCEELIAAGRVQINGTPAHFGTRVRAGDRVCVDGTDVRPQEGGGVWMLHKPAGTVSTSHDPEGRRTVLDLVRDQGLTLRLFPVGRLDQDTTGLLLLTDDGALAHQLTHPSQGIDKEYEARVGRALAPAELARLRGGMELEDGPSLPCGATQESRGGETLLRLVLHEGRKRQIRRMLQALEVPLLHLHRVRVGPQRLGALLPGALRALTSAEVEALRAAASRSGDTTAAQDRRQRRDAMHRS